MLDYIICLLLSVMSVTGLGLLEKRKRKTYREIYNLKELLKVGYFFCLVPFLNVGVAVFGSVALALWLVCIAIERVVEKTVGEQDEGY